MAKIFHLSFFLSVPCLPSTSHFKLLRQFIQRQIFQMMSFEENMAFLWYSGLGDGSWNPHSYQNPWMFKFLL
jgi:hypothetical protein